MRIIFYTREDCHLCDVAERLLSATAPDMTPEWVDVDDDDDLEARYGARVPVLRREPGGAELAWPFDAVSLAAFLGRGEY